MVCNPKYEYKKGIISKDKTCSVGLNITECVQIYKNIWIDYFGLFILRQLLLNLTITNPFSLGNYEFFYLNIKQKVSNQKKWFQTPWKFQGVYAARYSNEITACFAN